MNSFVKILCFSAYLNLIILLGSTSLYPQQLNWKHLGGPMGGTVGDMNINSQGDIYAGVYSSWIDYSGLYKSTDNGDSWNRIESQFEDFEVYSIYITKDDHIWIGTNFQGRIYLSTDNGISWENKRNGYNTGECWAFGESKDGVLFAGDGQYVQLYRSTNYGDTWELSANLRPLVFATDSNNKVYAGTFDGLFATTDNGLNWTQNNFLSNIPVSSILIDTNNNIYCSTGYYNNGNGVFYSTNGGLNWTQLGLAGKVVLSMSFDSEGSLYAGTKQDGLFRTTDMGQSWTQYQNGLYRKQVFRLRINKQDDIFIGSENEGIFRSVNNGESFVQIGLPISNVKNIVFSGDSLIFASTPSGVQKYNRINKEWSNAGLHNVEAISITPSDYLYAGTFDDGLYKSTDLGKSWELTNLTIDSLMSVYNVLAINDDTVFVATEFNLRRSLDAGESWTKLSVAPDFFRKGLTQNKSDNSIYVTGYKSPNYILYRTTNYGDSFDSLMSEFTVVETNGLSSYNYYILLAAASSTGGVFRSIDNGITWEKIIDNKNMRSIYLNSDGVILCSALDSLYYSNNFGNDFVNIPYILKPENYVSEIENDVNSKLFFGTYIEGIYEIDLITKVEENSEHNPQGYAFSQNYPNPFNSVTKIKYNLPVESNIEIKFFNVLGEEILFENLGKHSPGEYEYIFNSSGLPSGIYFYQLETDEYTSTRKMILLR